MSDSPPRRGGVDAPKAQRVVRPAKPFGRTDQLMEASPYRLALRARPRQPAGCRATPPLPPLRRRGMRLSLSADSLALVKRRDLPLRRVTEHESDRMLDPSKEGR